MTRDIVLTPQRRMHQYEKAQCHPGGCERLQASDAAPRWRKVIPYGLLFAPRFYLVARVKSRPEPVLFRLDRMRDLEPADEPGARPEDFDLEAYASRSFGVFQEEAEDIFLRFDPSAVAEARAYLFHSTQTVTEAADGSRRFVSARRGSRGSRAT